LEWQGIVTGLPAKNIKGQRGNPGHREPSKQTTDSVVCFILGLILAFLNNKGGRLIMGWNQCPQLEASLLEHLWSWTIPGVERGKQGDGSRPLKKYMFVILRSRR